MYSQKMSKIDSTIFFCIRLRTSLSQGRHFEGEQGYAFVHPYLLKKFKYLYKRVK